MINPEIYLEAAKRIVSKENWFSCDAIKYVNFPEVNKYQKLFMPSSEEFLSWDSWWNDFNNRRTKERSIALLFMYEIMKDLNNKKRK